MKERHFIANGYGMRRGKVLLGFHRKEKKWLPLGGHIEKGETPEQALRREFREESGLEIEFLTAKNVDRELHPPQRMNLVSAGRHSHINLIYFCRAKDGKIKISRKEYKEMKWFSKENLKKINLNLM